MQTITKFEDLECWKAARKLVKFVYQMSDSGKIAHEWELKTQLRRAALSIMNNLAEGFGRYGDKDSLRFYDTAKASAYEVKSMLYVLEDLEFLSPTQLSQLREQLNHTLSLTMGWIRYHAQKSPPNPPKP